MSSPMLPDANSIVIKGKLMPKNVEFGRKNSGLALKILKIHVSSMNFEPKVKPLERVTCFYIVSLPGAQNFQDNNNNENRRFHFSMRKNAFPHKIFTSIFS